MPLPPAEIARLRKYLVHRHDVCACGARKQRASARCRKCASKLRILNMNRTGSDGGGRLAKGYAQPHAPTPMEGRRIKRSLCVRCGHAVRLGSGPKCPACLSELALGYVTPDAFEQLLLPVRWYV